MSFLENTNNEQEEKILGAFLDSLKFNYKLPVQDDEETIQSKFLKQCNKELDEGVSEIDKGNFVLHSDVEKLFADKRKTLNDH